MKVTLEKVIDVSNGLVPTMKLSLPGKLSWRLVELRNLLNTFIKVFEDTRKKLFDDKGEDELLKDGTPTGQKVLKGENIKFVQDELTELLKSEVEVAFEKIKWPAQSKGKPVPTPTPEDMFLTQTFIDYTELED